MHFIIMLPTLCGQNFDIVLISAKMISTHLCNEILSLKVLFNVFR